jgi:ArsR family transcriptional regulator
MMQISKRSCCTGLEDEQAPGFFKALCDPTRIAILMRLARTPGELTVSQVACCTPIDISVVSRHLGTLRDAGVLSSEKRGKEVFYTVRGTALVESLRAIANEIEECCTANGCCQSTEDSNHE